MNFDNGKKAEDATFPSMSKELDAKDVEETLRLLKGGVTIELDGIDNVNREVLAKLSTGVRAELVSEWHRRGLGYPSASKIERVVFEMLQTEGDKVLEQDTRWSDCEKRYGWKLFVGAATGSLAGRLAPWVWDQLRNRL
jgi:hypothetical protein